MAVQRSTYAQNTIIQPYFLLKEKEGGTADFVIIDVPPANEMTVLNRLSQNVVWVKIEEDFVVSILTGAPNNVTAFSPAHPWDIVQLRLKESELFLTEYENTDKKEDEQTSVTGYNFDDPGTLYVKVDKAANTVTIYQPS